MQRTILTLIAVGALATVPEAGWSQTMNLSFAQHTYYDFGPICTSTPGSATSAAADFNISCSYSDFGNFQVVLHVAAPAQVTAPQQTINPYADSVPVNSFSYTVQVTSFKWDLSSVQVAPDTPAPSYTLTVFSGYSPGELSFTPSFAACTTVVNGTSMTGSVPALTCQPNALINFDTFHVPADSPFGLGEGVIFQPVWYPANYHGSAYHASGVQVQVISTFSSQPGMPSNPYPPDQPTDTRFVTQFASPTCQQSTGTLEFDVPVTRAIGTSSDLGSTGALLKPADFVSNGVVSALATVRVASYHHALTSSPAADEDLVRWNGMYMSTDGSQSYLAGGAEQWKINTFSIPIGNVFFPARVPVSAGSDLNKLVSPTPVTNKLTLEIDPASGSKNWCAAIGWVEISFQAMAPVIMVHGNSQGDDGHGELFWQGAILDDSGTRNTTIPFNFVSEFDAAHIPYEPHISMLTDHIAAHGTLLATLIPNAAARFGANHVHVVAHSKGGLDTRDFLARTLPKNFGVLSLTTLSTPHLGSVGPDLMMDGVQGSLLWSDSTANAIIGWLAPPNPGTPDLRVSFVAGFNRKNLPQLPAAITVDGQTSPVSYQTIGADADVNGNGTIGVTESIGIPGEPSAFTQSMWDAAMTKIYNLLGTVAHTALRAQTGSVLGISNTYVIEEVPTKTFQYNDLAVTKTSAAGAGPFTKLTELPANHSTIAGPDAARAVIGHIKAVQPIQ